MTKKPKNPELSEELYKRILLVRRDISNLLFHFTRTPSKHSTSVSVNLEGNSTMTMPNSAASILRKILYEGRLKGTSGWTAGQECVCFTEAPIQEFNSIFALNKIAAKKKQRPRYEPYGIAVTKKFLFHAGGRPVIYDRISVYEELPESQRYRLVEYDPENGKDYTWEREWRIRTDYMKLDPKETLVVVPTSDEVFELVYEYAEEKPDYDNDPSPTGSYHEPKWFAVSLDLFGVEYS